MQFLEVPEAEKYAKVDPSVWSACLQTGSISVPSTISFVMVSVLRYHIEAPNSELGSQMM